MNKVLLTMAFAAVFVIGVGVISSPASAFLDVDCRGNSCNDNSTVNSGGEGGTGIGIGVGFGGEGGKGGKGGKGGTGGTSSVGDVKAKVKDSGNSTNANNSSVVVEGDSYEAADIPVSSAHAAALTSADDTCMGSTSAGVQAMGFGASLGSTWRDEDCVRRKDARMFFNMSMPDVALARMCQKDDNRSAVESAGAICPGTEASATPVAVAMATVEEVKVVEESAFDRLRRNRNDR